MWTLLKCCVAQTLCLYLEIPVFAVAGMLLIVFAILFAVMGTQQIVNASDSIQETSASLHGFLDEATHVSALVGSLRDRSDTLHQRLKKQDHNHCPGFSDYDSSDLGKHMNEIFSTTREKLEVLRKDLGKAVDTLDQGIDDLRTGLNTCDAATEDVDENQLLGRS